MYKHTPVAPPSFRNKMARALWGVVWLFLFRPTPKPFHWWRCLLLRLFGAKIGKPAYVYPSSRIWAPWNLEMGVHSTLADGVNCYCQTSYANELKQLVKSLGLNNVSISGPIFGGEKQTLLRGAELFALSTLNENFGMTVAESLAVGTPVISTKGLLGKAWKKTIVAGG